MMHTIEQGRGSLRKLTHKLVDGNPNSIGNPPSNLLGMYVSILSEDKRLGLVTVQGYDWDTGKVITDQFNTECVEVIK